jgi:hypothetical protein
LFDLLLHNLGSLGHCLSSSHLLLHESQTLIFLMESYQFIFNDCFDLFFQFLLLIFLSFGFLKLGWLLRWLLKSFGFCCCYVRVCGCLWLDDCLGCFEDLSSGRLRRAFYRKLLSEFLLGWHFVGVLLSTQTVSANVGIR